MSLVAVRCPRCGGKTRENEQTGKRFCLYCRTEVERKQDSGASSILRIGSYIDGTPTVDSDIDVAVIFDDFKGDWLETTTLLSRLKRKVNLLIEPHLLGESEDVTGFLAHVRQTGEILV